MLKPIVLRMVPAFGEHLKANLVPPRTQRSSEFFARHRKLDLSLPMVGEGAGSAQAPAV